jgi:hypothetical protein
MELRQPPRNDSTRRSGRSLGAVIALQVVLILLVGVLAAMHLRHEEPARDADRLRKVLEAIQ